MLFRKNFIKNSGLKICFDLLCFISMKDEFETIKQLLLTIGVCLSGYAIIFVKGYHRFLPPGGVVDNFCCSYWQNPCDQSNPKTRLDFRCFAPSAGDLPILVTVWIVQLSGILAANIYQLFSIFICPNIDRMDVNFIEKFVDDPLSYCPLWEPNHPTFYPLMAKATPPEEEADLSSQKKDQ